VVIYERYSADNLHTCLCAIELGTELQSHRFSQLKLRPTSLELQKQSVDIPVKPLKKRGGWVATGFTFQGHIRGTEQLVQLLQEDIGCAEPSAQFTGI